MSIVHDLAESIVGDITPYDGRYSPVMVVDEVYVGVSKDEKYKLEEKAIKEICSTLGDSAVGKDILDLWAEYEAGSTPEAILVKV